ncbi:hypothetical protein BD324DRAFT_647669 [Kockovaella imperatae]|uniref:Protein ZIP4 homolog n=1 Tax=Kockovaella imperatae TaxID=4999 RepID=A0A1Y1UTK1_9TREE|nr:hypothetical protein BD324DRAFT_647669 [Kockovaella imperatae]ORX40756.1 hypothetical protein BD324DRAFT_647669 [Kockovaella imperatae]
MPQDYFGPIQEALKHLRPLLIYLPVSSTTPSDRVESLKEALSAVQTTVGAYGGRRKGKRGRGDGDAQKADWLDTEGVSIFNQARAASKRYEGNAEIKEDLDIAAQVRLTAYKMIEAASDSKPRPSQLQRDLYLLSRTAAAVMASNQKAKLEELLTHGAELEQDIRTVLSGKHSADTAEVLGSILDFYLVRIDFAFNEDNAQLASTIARKALGKTSDRTVDDSLPDLRRMGQLNITDVKRLAHHCWKISEELCFKGADQLYYLDDALAWTHICLEAANLLQQDFGEDARWFELEISVVHTMIKAYRLKGDPDSLERGYAAVQSLQEMIGEGDPRSIHALALYSLSLLKERGGTEDDFKKHFRLAVDTMIWSMENVHSLLFEISRFREDVDKHDWAMELFLNSSLRYEPAKAFTGTILLNVIYASRGRAVSDPERCIVFVGRLLDGMMNSGEMSDIERTACAHTLYGLADLLVEAEQKRYNQAAGLYTLAAHPVLAVDDSDKILRKAAMCHILAGDYDRAKAKIRDCPEEGAATYYLHFLIGLNMGQEEVAIEAIQKMASCEDLGANQLLNVASLSQRSEYDQVLIACIQLMLSMADQFSEELYLSKMELPKALIHLLYKGVEKEASGDEELFERIQGVVKNITQDCYSDPDFVQQHGSDVAWVAKTAYNMGIKSIATCSQSVVASIFDTAAQLMDMIPEGIDPRWSTYVAIAKYTCFCGNLFSFRSMEPGIEKKQLLEGLRNYLPVCRDAVTDALKNVQDKVSRLQLATIFGTLKIFEVELLAASGEWDAVARAVTMPTEGSKNTVEVMESVMDIINRNPDCPVEITGQVLGTLIQTFDKSKPEGIVGYSRWVRVAVDFVRLRNAEGDQTRVMEYVKKALEVIKTAPPTTYPQEEIEWLMTSAWNRRMRKYEAAKHWWELALQIGIHVSNREGRLQQMHDHYNRLLTKLEGVERL